MSWESNVYYHPEKHGLSVVGSIEWGFADYSFDMTCVWKDADGNLYWASDSGCSCPTPFEDYDDLDDLNTGSRQELREYLRSQLEHSVNRTEALVEMNDLLSSL